MRNIYSLWFIPVLVAVLVSCAGEKSAKTEDFNKTLYKPQYATGFEIKGAEGRSSTLLTVSNPWQGADSVKTQLFIARGGEKAPEGFKGQVLNGDGRRIVAMSSTHVALLDAVGAADKVVGVSGLDFIFNPVVQARRDSVGEVGFDGNLNYEVLLGLDPDIVLLYGVNGASKMEGKLKELGIPFMYVGDYLEESPLGKAEWMVPIAEILGMRGEGEKVFADIPVRYNALKEKAAAATSPVPSVMLNTPYNDAWLMPSTKNYSVRLINDAGGNYIYKKNSGNSSVPVDMEEVYMLASNADVWLNTGQATSLADVKRMCPKFTDIKCFRDGKVYNNNRRLTPAGGNDYYESAISRPDLVLRDLIKIFHPELISEDFVYYRNLN